MIEFQYSFLKPEEQKSRNNFYEKLIWVINGKRLKGDEKKLAVGLARGVNFDGFYRIPISNCFSLSDWSDKHTLVFFDFGESVTHLEKSDLWLILPKHSDSVVYVKRFSKIDFFDFFLHESSEKAKNFEHLLENWPILAQRYDQQFEANWRKKMDIIHKQIKEGKKPFYRKSSL